MITRRTALKGLGALAGAATAPRLLTGCSSRPKGITNLVVVCMENRSYDHYLGARKLLESKPGDGLVAGMSVLDENGQKVEIFHTDVACVADPPHGWNPSHAQWNMGKNDGFMTEYRAKQGAGIPPHVMGYLTREDLPFTWALADASTSCDRWFCAILAPTWPNRSYLISAQSGGLKSNDLPPESRFNWPTIFHRLTEKGVEWGYYWSDLPFLSLWGPVAPASSLRKIEAFYQDAAAGRLPPMTFIEPAFAASDDHPPHHPIMGQQFLASVYNALAASPQWENILLVITYDENGGFYDHVPPPTAPDDRAADGFGQLGFRVPTIIAGPYARPGYVSSTVYNHTSVLRHAEKMFGLEPLTMRDAAAADLTDALDATRLAAFDPLPPAKLPPVVVDESMIDATCRTAAAGASSDLETAADRGLIPADLDRRTELRDLLFHVGDQLDLHGAGRIRRGR